MNNIDILIMGLSWLVISAIIFRIVFVRESEGRFKIVMNKFDLTLFGKILSIALCFPIFTLFVICTACYLTIVKRK